MLWAINCFFHAVELLITPSSEEVMPDGLTGLHRALGGQDLRQHVLAHGEQPVQHQDEAVRLLRADQDQHDLPAGPGRAMQHGVRRRTHDPVHSKVPRADPQLRPALAVGIEDQVRRIDSARSST